MTQESTLIGDPRTDHEALLAYLMQFVSPHKQKRIEDVLNLRTRFLTIVLEDLFHPYNASACLRSCEAFGVQDMHLIENQRPFRINRDIAVGAGHWLTLHRYPPGPQSTAACLGSLRAMGYRIVATSPHGSAVSLEEFEITQKTAIVFGTEADGLSAEAIDMADARVKISTCGFAESLNLSVSVAVAMHHLTARLRHTSLPWQLTETEKAELRLAWVKQITRRWLEPLERAFDRERRGTEI